uniref:Uncharacterized protein n=1 Tax=Sphaerodactylus townsendi TaxID=933632 RepID=A0ACB8EL31_9SAUR
MIMKEASECKDQQLTFATCGTLLELMNLLLVFQVALRIRPVSMAELEEGATLIAHKVDDQVLWKAFL